MDPRDYTLGPEDARLTVRTGKSGAAAKAGHNLLIEVTSWKATLALGEDPAATALTLSVDAGSLKVREGSGGMQSLGDDDKANIEQTIIDEVLKGTAIEFRSSDMHQDGGRYHVEGELELSGSRAPIAFDLIVGEGGHLNATATLTQSAWGMKPYSALFGTLKVNDDVVVEVDGQLPAA
jgi:polyisoprenoid-binding protein YceI